MIGEIGGDAEERAAAFIEAARDQAGRRLRGRGSPRPRARPWATRAPSCPVRPVPPRPRRRPWRRSASRVGKTPPNREPARLMPPAPCWRAVGSFARPRVRRQPLHPVHRAAAAGTVRAAAAKAGFDAVELWWPFDGPVPAEQRELDRLPDGRSPTPGCGSSGSTSTPATWPRATEGCCPGPTGRRGFRANIDVAVGLAERLGCRRAQRALRQPRGRRGAGGPAGELALENLLLAAEAAASDRRHGGASRRSTPREPALSGPRRPHGAVPGASTRCGAANLAFLADLYHLPRMGEDVLALIDRTRRRFGHVQIADGPGRGQPGTGAMPYNQIFERLAAVGYRRPRRAWSTSPVGAEAPTSFAWRNG